MKTVVSLPTFSSREERDLVQLHRGDDVSFLTRHYRTIDLNPTHHEDPHPHQRLGMQLVLSLREDDISNLAIYPSPAFLSSEFLE